MIETAKLRRAALVGLCTLTFGIPVRTFAQDPPTTKLISTHFTEEDGLLGNVVDSISQTADGFLWVETSGVNLLRFDGRTFYMFDRRIASLVAAQGAGLWTGARDGLTYVPPQDLSRFAFKAITTYPPEPGRQTVVTFLRVAHDGGLWVATNRGLYRYDGGHFVALGPRVAVRNLEETPEGHLLLMTTMGFVELDGSAVVPHPDLARRLGVKDADIFHVLKDRRGNTWYSTALGLVRDAGGHIERVGAFGPGGHHDALRTYEDADGTIWVGKITEGLFRATANGLEPIAPGLRVRSLFGDRDGNLWVGTNGDGLYRFKRSVVRMFTKDDGLPGDVIQTVLTARDGSLWTGANCGGLSRFDGSRFHTYNEKDGLLNDCVWSLAEDTGGDLWVGTWGGGAFRFHNGTFTQFSKKEGLADDRVQTLVAGRDGTMWFGTHVGVSRLSGGKISNFKLTDAPALVVFRLVEDRSGVLWAGTRLGLYRFVNNRFEPCPLTPKSTLIPLGDDPGGGILASDDETGAVFLIKNDRADVIAAFPSGVVDIIETAQGDRWLGSVPIRRLPRGVLTLARAPDEPLDYESFTVADGLLTAELSSLGQRSFTLTPDGKLWVATSKGLARFDLGSLPVVNTKPSIYLTNLIIGRKTVRPTGEIVLPAGTNHLQVDFGAIETTSPEKIRLQYRMDHVDSEWLDAGSDRRAIYSTLPPGIHALHIRACNRSGIWDRQGVVFSITQQPFFYQTRGFILAMGIVGVLLVATVYRLRVRQMSRVMSARFDERLAERTRVARELHDTLLQTVQGGKMVADHALKDTADHARAIRALEQLSTWLTQATEEGRTALNSLRASATETNDLAEALRRALDESRGMTGAETSFAAQGEAVEMHPVVRDEIYRIGYEAIRNACAHSGGSLIDVTLEYGHDLKLRISDNGVGIDAETVDKGKGSHFGLRGMRERAERIGARFTLVSAPGSGTVITLVVPGRIVFLSAGPTEKHR